MLSMVDWPLIGRAEDLPQSRTLRPDSRYGGVVIAGGPGVGKTRLAAEAVRNLPGHQVGHPFGHGNRCCAVHSIRCI